MPSHISHALLVEAALAAIRKGRAATLHDSIMESFAGRDSDIRAIAILGAQGPDIFLHNHRRKPRAFRYGAILHRKGNARVLSSLAEQGHTSLNRAAGEGTAESAGEDAAEEAAEANQTAPGIYSSHGAHLPLPELAAFTLGYITHVWLDRLVHPYVNYSTGWRGVPDDRPERPAMHAFLERIIDIQLLRYRRDQSVREYHFLDRLPSPDRDLSALRQVIARALRVSLKSAADDQLLEIRLENALYDSLRYYRRTESPGEEFFSIGRARERNGLVGIRWLSVVHPPEELLTVDALNLEHRRWQHPCDPSRTTNASVPELFERALAHSLEVFSLWMDIVFPGGAITHPPGSPVVVRPVRIDRLEEVVGKENLNDGIAEDPPCRRRTCNPLPLIELYQQIKSAFDR